MKPGVFAVLFADRPFGPALDRAVEAGLEAVEIGALSCHGNPIYQQAANACRDHAVFAATVRKGVAFLRGVMLAEPALTDAWWT